jgi:hypothetical protein
LGTGGWYVIKLLHEAGLLDVDSSLEMAADAGFSSTTLAAFLKQVFQQEFIGPIKTASSAPIKNLISLLQLPDQDGMVVTILSVIISIPNILRGWKR